MKKIIYLLLIGICSYAQGQIKINQLQTATSLDGDELFMFWQNSKTVQNDLGTIKDFISGVFYYKTIYVDSAKIRNNTDTVFIAKSGTDSAIVIDEILMKHDSTLNYDTMACFMIYPGVTFGTAHNFVKKILYWETKNDTLYSQDKNQKLFPIWDQNTCIRCAGVLNWTYPNTEPAWQLSRSLYKNTSMHFLVGNHYYYNGKRNATGRRKFVFRIKYHIEKV